MSEPLYNEELRPQFHFSARRGWLNDPNGLVWHAGEYHLFFQHNPFGTEWGNITWGHAISPDLVHWTQLDNAIMPDRLGTIFSGSAVVDHENTAGFQTGAEPAIVAIYTAAGDTSEESRGQPYTQCIAYSTDRGRTFTKFLGNPVLPHIVGTNRDPKVAWYAPDRVWIMTLYLDGHTYGFFSSPDLKRWTFLHDMDVPGCSECPDFFEMSVEGEPGVRRWVWTSGNGHYLVGTFDGRRFVPESGPVISDWGSTLYAGQSFSDIPASDGRRIQIAWMYGGTFPKMPFNQQMSVPCELTLHRFPEGLRLCRRPVRELEGLRTAMQAWADVRVEPNGPVLVSAPAELQEVRAELEPVGAQIFGLRLHGAVLRFVPDASEAWLHNRAAPLDCRGRVRVHALIDRTSVEVFVNDGRLAWTTSFLPPDADRSVGVIAFGGPVYVHSIEVHTLRSAWPQPAE